MPFQSGRSLNGTFIETPETNRRAFTPVELRLIDEIKAVTPKGYVEGIPNSFDVDIRLLGVASQSLSDYNDTQPEEQWKVSQHPPSLTPLIAFGAQIYMALFRQMELALVDINYNDNGLSISWNRTNNLNTVIGNLKPIWERRIQSRKMGVLVAAGGIGLRTPRYQGALARIISCLGDGAYGWGVV